MIVENGGFADLCTDKDGNVDLSTLKFFAIGNIQNTKYLDIPLEEDRFVLVFLAPIQRNSLVQSPWGEGLFFDVFSLTDDEGVKYKDFYDKFVTNIGDKLFGIVSMAEHDFINTTENEFNTITSAKPVIDKENIKVTLINKHLNNSETISEIYNLYKQKEDYKVELSSVQKQIDEINTLLSTLSFEDTTTSRTIYTDQLTDLNSRKKDITSSIANCIQQITIASTDTDTPVENPKYHIRGFFDYNKFLRENKISNLEIIKIDVQYRYKNATKVTGNAETIGKIQGTGENNPDETAIYSDWNVMQSFISERYPVYNSGVYKFVYEGDTSSKNVPSFNQFDIPISQGETVDIRMRVVYSIGYPFVKTTSNWSDIVNVEFPVELRKNVTVLDIIKENNSDTTKEAFRGYLEKYGVIEHVSDKLIDQNITYFHQPEHIASGFYTEERRVIPLRDKLQSITNDVITLRDEVFGTSSNSLSVTITDGEAEVIVVPNSDNTFILKDYSASDKTNGELISDFVETVLTLSIKNSSSTNSLKLFSMFPGNKNIPVLDTTQSKFDNSDYISNICVPIYLDSYENASSTISNFILQRQNQYMYFRLNNAFNGAMYYEKFSASSSDSLNTKLLGPTLAGNYDDSNEIKEIKTTDAQYIDPTLYGDYTDMDGMVVYPRISNIDDICISNEDNNMYKLLLPGETLQIPICVKFKLSSEQEVQKTISFDLRNSLYTDPLNYQINLKAKYSNSLENNTRKIKKVRYNPVIIN